MRYEVCCEAQKKLTHARGWYTDAQDHGPHQDVGILCPHARQQKPAPEPREPQLHDDSGEVLIREAVAAHLPGVPEGLSVEVRMATELQRTWTGLEEDRNLLTPGFLMAADDPIVRAAAAAVGTREDERAPAHVRPWTFATDGGWSCGVHGVPTVGFAPGEERYAHTNRERLDVDEARWAFSRHGALIMGVQEAAAG